MSQTKLTPEIISKQAEAKQRFISAKASNSGINMAKEQMKNLLFNYFDELIDAAIEIGKLREENDMLDAALRESDREIDRLRDEIAELSAPHTITDDKKASRQSKKMVDGE